MSYDTVPEGSVLARSTSGTCFFWCPGCEGLHGVWLKGVPSPHSNSSWDWNGDYVKPTFNPSILVHGWKSEMPEIKSQARCHSFVKDGMISYCGDTEHALANQTVPLPANPLEMSKS